MRATTMIAIKFFWLIAFGLSTFGVTNINGLCNKCSTTNYVACLNDTAFVACFDGLTKSDTIDVCPEGQVCTPEQGVCKARAAGAVPECGACNVCSSGFACISKTQFEYCDGASLTGIIGTCPNQEYCSLPNLIQNRRICAKSCLSEPTCYEKEIVLPKPTPAPDYTTNCVGTTTPGNFKNIYDPSCKSFVYCEKLGNDMHTVLLNCAEGTYFSAAQGKCVATKPNGCT